MGPTPDRPVFLNLIKIRLPLQGVISILHRVSGVILVFSFPIVIYLLEQVLTSEEGYRAATEFINFPIIKLALAILIWSVCHHLFAGFRYLFMDTGFFETKKASRITALIVLVLSLVTSLGFLRMIW